MFNKQLSLDSGINIGKLPERLNAADRRSNNESIIGKSQNIEIRNMGLDEVDLSEEYSDVKQKIAKMKTLNEEGVISHEDFEAAKNRLLEQARKAEIEKENKVCKREFENIMEKLNKLHDEDTLSVDEFERAKNKATENYERSLSDIERSLSDIERSLSGIEISFSAIEYKGFKIHKNEGKFAVGGGGQRYNSIKTAKEYIDHYLI